MTTNNQSTTPVVNKTTQLKKFQEETVNKVLLQVKEFEQDGALQLPEDYSAANALKAAWFTLLQCKDANKKPVLETCTNISIVNSLMEMVTQGLNPAKKQCSFIAYGNQLQMQREYFGSIALAKRYNPEIADITGNVIFKDDDFTYNIDALTGRKTLVKHDQKLENLDKEIVGAYATIVLTDGTSYIEPMTMAMIRKAWEQGPTKGNSPAHKNFPDQMSIKTAINRACKPHINSSDDSEIVSGNAAQNFIPNTANSKPLDIEDGDAEPVIEEQQSNEPNEDKAPENSDNLTFKNWDEARAFMSDSFGLPEKMLDTEAKILEAARLQNVVLVVESSSYIQRKANF